MVRTYTHADVSQIVLGSKAINRKSGEIKLVLGTLRSILLNLGRRDGVDSFSVCTKPKKDSHIEGELGFRWVKKGIQYFRKYGDEFPDQTLIKYDIPGRFVCDFHANLPKLINDVLKVYPEIESLLSFLFDAASRENSVSDDMH